MITLIVFAFDMGGVTVNNSDVIPKIFEFYGMDKEYFTNKGFYSLLKKLSIGSISEEIFWKDFCDKTNLKNNGNLFEKFFNPELNQDTAEIIKKLKENYRVICITNTIESHYNIHMKNGDYNLFDKVYTSFSENIQKPDGKFYLSVLEKENIHPGELIFTDDSEENINSALKLGIKAIHFKNPELLRKDLKNFINFKK
ncbi:MAG TPA: HAD family phosphatase [Tepiditoga sp.]|nr:HAD family phosphatase [Tepiditoga sp.]